MLTRPKPSGRFLILPPEEEVPMAEEELKQVLLSPGTKKKLSEGLISLLEKSSDLSPAETVEVIVAVRAKPPRPGHFRLSRAVRDRIQKQDADEASARLRHALHLGGAELMERLWQKGGLRVRLSLGLLADITSRPDVVALRLAGED
jgi:hypothetical protein